MKYYLANHRTAVDYVEEADAYTVVRNFQLTNNRVQATCNYWLTRYF